MAARATILAGLITLVAAAVAGNWLRVRDIQAAGSPGLAGITLATHSGVGLAFAEAPMDDRFLAVLKADEVSFREYTTDDGGTVWVFLGYFSRQKEGSQVHSPRHCYPGTGWSIVDERRAVVHLGDSQPARLVVSDGTVNRVVYYWYQTPYATMSNEFALKGQLTRDALAGRAPEVVFARVSTLASNGPEDADPAWLAHAAQDVHRQITDRFRARNGASQDHTE